MTDLAGKVAIIAGGTKGMGPTVAERTSVAERMGETGASVVVGARTAGDVDATAEGPR